MRIVFFCLSCITSAALIICLGTSSLLPLPLGSFLSPQHGIWQNAEPVKQNFTAKLLFPALKGKSTVYLDDRLVPHIVADNDEDACFLQGYLHARFRLWQMEFQTYAAAGRISEIVGDKAVNFDKGKDTDVWALANNYVSVVPVQFDLTNYVLKTKLEKTFK
mgnify:CR=1 FL=1